MIRLEDSSSCLCVSKHIPLPLNLVEYNNLFLCPVSYCNLQSLLLEWHRHGGRPPGHVRKHYSRFVQDLAEQTFEQK